MDEPVFTQSELEDIVMNTLTNLMVIVDYMTGGSEVPLTEVRKSLLKNKDDLVRWMESNDGR